MAKDTATRPQSSDADQILDLVGGPENIADVYHCQTRLRFTLRDDSRANSDEIGKLDSVAGTVVSGGTFQVIIGPRVKSVFDDLQKSIVSSGAQPPTAGAATASGDAPKGEPKKPNVVSRVIDFISSTFVPIIPALAGAGLVAAILAILVTFGVVTTDSQTYIVISFMSNTLFFFLPVFLAFSAAGKLGANRFLAAVVGAMMVHPVWAGLVAEGEPVLLFEVIPLTLTVYSSTVIPVLIVVYIQSKLERLLERFIPEAIKIVVIPMVLFFVMGILALSVFGPIGAILSGYLATFFEWLQANAAWAPPLLYGTLHPILVMFGLHTAIGPVGYLQLGQLGYESLTGPGALASNIAKGTAAAVVALRTKDRKFRQIAGGSAITSFMGISEPAIYGVLLPKRYPLIAAMIGGGAGGLYVGLTSVRRFAGGSSGILALPMYIGDDTLMYMVNMIIGILIAIAVTAAATLLLSLRFERPSAIEEADAAAEAAAAAAAAAATSPEETSAADSASIAVARLTSPCNGTVVALENVRDAAFASGALGPGLGIEPAEGNIVAPCSGTIVAAMETGHAFGIRTDDGVDVLVHVGIDTVTLKGAGFDPAVAQGDRVEAGQTLVRVELDILAAAELPATVIVVVTDADDADVTPIAAGDVVAGEPIVNIDRASEKATS